MKVLLQDTISKRYYAGPQRWVSERAEALDFGQIDLAAKAYTEETTRYAEIVIDDGTLPESSPSAANQPRAAGSARARSPR